MSSHQADFKDLNARVAESWGKRTWLTTLTNALVITRREVRDSFRDWRIIIPIFLLTLVFPLLANLASALFAGLIERSSSQETNVSGITEALLPLLPMLVGFFPISMSLVIALETFVGEKERLSLEPLLSTPLTNTELYIGKVLAAIFPPLAAGYLGIGLYVTGQILGSQQWRPSAELIIQILLLTAIQATVMVTGAVVISSQTTSTRAANLLASAVIIPMSMLVIIESIIMVQPAQRFSLWWIMLGLLIVVALLLRMGARIFNREELLGRSVDHVNLGWAVRVFGEQWRGGVQGFQPMAWYRQSVWPAFVRLQRALLAYIVFSIMSFIGGWLLQMRYPLNLDDPTMREDVILLRMRQIVNYGPVEPSSMLFVLAQNLRIIGLATFLSPFSFGVSGLLLISLPFAIYGYILANTTVAGLDPLPYLAIFLPHGIIEIPAFLIAGAAALQLGAVVTHPPEHMTVGEAWLRQFADTIKIGVGVVLPLLILASLLKVHLTPNVIEWAISR